MTYTSKLFVFVLLPVALVMFGAAFYLTYMRDQDRSKGPAQQSVSTQQTQAEGTVVRMYEGRSECDGKIYYSVQEALKSREAACALVLRDVSAFPLEVTQLPNLGEFVIRSEEITVLPSQAGELTSLEVLDVAGSKNLRSFLPDLFPMQSLRLLNISGTAITTLPSGIENLKGLQRFFVHDGQFLDEDLAALRAKLPNTQIIELDPRLISQ